MNDYVIEWVRKARFGDQEAFGKLVAEYQTRVFRVAAGIIGRREDAEDIAQETFVKAYKYIGDLKVDVTFYSWLMRIAVNTSMNFKKSFQRQQFLPIDGISEPVDKGETPEGAVERQESYERVTNLLAELSPEHRAVLALRDIEGLAYDEIASMLDIPLGTVKSRMNYGRNKLRQLVMRGGAKE
ncbi:MAG TPA: sigma-70 family RNA polymerase sigma factor [Negativicutes bacterium]